ncbi:hypothetical protein [Marinoscillum sp. MHG1-6]|uniref:hypothetical protein n=1 Tax=Marinoscillum sp. MHG1-6 TaxID=2959627 RepID=UPI0021573D71|nr:hypothetical protein [Marinoscillum sp. MHG1-6]
MKTTHPVLRIIGINYGTYFSIFAIMALLILVMSSCANNDEDIIAPAPVSAPMVVGNNEDIWSSENQSTKGIENAPNTSGSFVIRDSYEGAFALTLVDNVSKLVATIGYPDLIPTYCGGGFPEDVVAFQDIIAANNGDRALSLGQGKMHVKVFQGPLSTVDFSEWCPFFTNSEVLAEGTVRVISPTNELYPAETNNKMIWSVQFHGKLLTLDNEIKNVSGGVLFTWDKEEEFNSLLDLVERVSLQLH